MCKNGGGTSGYFGALRKRGDKISTGGEASGPVHYMQAFDSVANIISQGSTRRGHFAAYLDIEHPDIEEFMLIRSKGNPIQDMSFGVCISNEWMQSAKDGDKDKRQIWSSIIKKKFESGYPYILWSDTVNQNKPQVYIDLEMMIHASNMCVAGDQLVPSTRGLKEAKTLWEEGGDLTLTDNNGAVHSSAMTLIEKDVPVFEIVLKNGMSHKVTSYHKLPVKDGRSSILKECSELQVGDSLFIQTTKGVFGNVHKPQQAFLNGLYQGDGTQTEHNVLLDIWENDFDLEAEIVQAVIDVTGNQNAHFTDQTPSFSGVKKKRLYSPSLKKDFGFAKGVLPDFVLQGDEETQWSYVRGLFFADGTVSYRGGYGDPIYLSLSSIDLEFVKRLQLLLSNLGCNFNLSVSRPAGENLLPDGKGGSKIYNTKEIYRLVCSSKADALVFNKNTGFLDRKGIVVEDRVYRNNKRKVSEIVSITPVGNENVYCVKVDTSDHLWVCNGLVTHNCTEIMLPSGVDFSFVCCLASVNLLYYQDWKDTDLIKVMIYFLDTVLTDFINKAKGIPFMERSVKFAEEHRALGLGVLGYHSYLQSNMIPFASMEAQYWNKEAFKLIDEQSLEATKVLATLYGEPEILKGYGERNTTRIAIAPTTSSSYILGQVSPGIEPWLNNYFIEDNAKGMFIYKNKNLERILIEKGRNTKDVWDSILHNDGSVQHLDFLDDHEKEVFKSFIEISQKEIVVQAAQRQRYIDQAQSINLMIHPKANKKEVNELYFFAWEAGLKSLYYQRGVNVSQELANNLLNCAACEA